LWFSLFAVMIFQFAPFISEDSVISGFLPSRYIQQALDLVGGVSNGFSNSVDMTVGLIAITIPIVISLGSALALHEKDDHILIDTIGRSPHEAAKLGQMHELLKGCGAEATYSLVVSATTKMSDLEVIKTHYHPFNFSSVIITKLDETGSIGNIISAFAEGNTPFVYYTDGQSVPLDIKNASKGALLKKISGFNINKSSYEER